MRIIDRRLRQIFLVKVATASRISLRAAGNGLARAIEAILGELPAIEWRLATGLIDEDCYTNRLTELVLRRVLTATSTCVDVGAHRGLILRLFMKYAPRGRFLAFEPVPELFRQLSSELAAENVHVFGVALSDATGPSPFNYVLTNPGYSGLRKRRYDREGERETEITVETDTLDRVLAREGVGRVDALKVDVEGAEYLVFRGAVGCLERDRPFVLFEHGLGAADCYGNGPEDVFELLCDRCGLHISSLAGWLRGRPPLDRRALCERYYSGAEYFFLAHP